MIPGMAVSVTEALRRYSAGTLQERVEGYYYDSYIFGDETDIPDLSRMTYIERLEMLHAKRKQLEDWKAANPGGELPQGGNINDPVAEPSGDNGGNDQGENG